MEIKNIMDMKLDTGVRHRFEYLQQRDMHKAEDMSTLKNSYMTGQPWLFNDTNTKSAFNRSRQSSQLNKIFNRSEYNKSIDKYLRNPPELAENYRLSVTTRGSFKSNREANF